MRSPRLFVLLSLLVLGIVAAVGIGPRWVAHSQAGQLVDAVLSRDTAAANRLLENGADPNTRIAPQRRYFQQISFTRPALLVVAVHQDDLAMAKLLLRHGASPAISDEEAKVSLRQVAAQQGGAWSRLFQSESVSAKPLRSDAPEVDPRLRGKNGISALTLIPLALAILGVARIALPFTLPYRGSRRLGWAITLGGTLIVVAILMFAFPNPRN